MKTPKPFPLPAPAVTEALPVTPNPGSAPAPIADGPSLGAAMLARKSGSRWWVILVVIAVAALGLVAYIVTK